MKKTIICLITILTVFSFAGLTNVDAYPFQKGEKLAGIGSISSVFPEAWSYETLVSGSGNIYLPGNAGIRGGNTLHFVVNDVAVINAAEGPVWEQSWLSGDSHEGNRSGLTALVPEPGTLILFGSGLAGLLYVRHKKVFNL